MKEYIDRSEAIKLITQYDGVVDKSVAKRILTQMDSADVDRYFTSDGKTFGNITGFLNNEVKKTGRHFPEVAELLDKMRGES